MSARATFVLAFAAALACACRAPAHEATAPSAETTLWHEAASAAGTWRVRWRSEPDPLVAHATARLLVEALRTDGAFADELRADAGMPEHSHGLVRHVAVEPLGAGRFAVHNVYLQMPGAWRVYLDLGRDGIFERVELELELD